LSAFENAAGGYIGNPLQRLKWQGSSSFKVSAGGGVGKPRQRLETLTAVETLKTIIASIE
jgi:hypothetical protein